MSTQAVGSSGYNGVANLLRQLKGQETEQGEASQKLTKGWRGRIREQVNNLLKDIPKGDDGKLSFKDIDTHRKDLEKKWDDAVKADLKKLGVDVEKEFPLSWDSSTGKLTVSKDHPDKKTIDKYFADNPDRVKDFKRIIQLGKMTSVSKQKLTPVDMQQSLQSQSIAWWYQDNTDPSTWFKGGGLLLNNNMKSYTGLNLKV